MLKKKAISNFWELKVKKLLKKVPSEYQHVLIFWIINQILKFAWYKSNPSTEAKKPKLSRCQNQSRRSQRIRR